MQLLGDLLFHISGVSGKMTTETASEDDNFGTAQSNKVTRNELLEQTAVTAFILLSGPLAFI